MIAIHHNCCAPRVAISAVLFALLGACHAQQKFPALAAQAAREPETQWLDPSVSGPGDEKGSIDLSFLNENPAGQHGFVRAEDGHFVDDRGLRLRFFGVSLSGVACLPERADADRLAQRLSRLGFNAVRLIGLDTPGALLGESGEISAAALEQLDYFTAALSARGLYFSLVLRSVSEQKLLDRFHESFLTAQERFAKALLMHDNPFTKRAYREEPALLHVELANEDTLLPSWAGSPDDLPASFRSELAARYKPWLAARTAEGKRAPGPADEEAKAELPTMQSPASARNDYVEFLASVERESVARLTRFVRTELGLRSMLVDTQASFGGLAGVLRERTASDFIDVHGYWDMPHAAGDARWSIQNTSQISASEAGTLGVLASYRVFGKPFMVSEYAVGAPNAAAAEMLPLLVGVAGLQDWDALYAFAYADQKRDYEPTRINGAFDLAGHPSKLAFVSNAALAFRRALVAPSKERVELSIPEQPSALPVTENALPQLWTEHGVPGSAAVLRQLGISVRAGSGAISASYALHPTGALGSDTGEVLWVNDGPHPRFSVDAPSLKLVCGRLSNTSLELSGVGLELPEFSPDFACVGLVALDQQPIVSSHRLLLSVAGLAENASAAPLDPKSFASLGPGPARAQYVPVQLSLPRAAWQAMPLTVNARPLAVTQGTRSRIATEPNNAALGYSITR